MPRVTPRALASIDMAVAIPRSAPVTTGKPRSDGFFAISTATKNESPSRWRIVRLVGRIDGVELKVGFLAELFGNSEQLDFLAQLLGNSE